MRNTIFCMFLVASCSLGCQHEPSPELVEATEDQTSLQIASTNFEDESPWPPSYAFHDEDYQSLFTGPSLAPLPWEEAVVCKEEFVDHDLRVCVIVRKEETKETLYKVTTERLGREGYQAHSMFRAPHELPRLLHLLSMAYGICLNLESPSEAPKYIAREITEDKTDSGLSYRPTVPPPHTYRDDYRKVADFTMEGRRVRLHERVGQNVLFADLCTARLLRENGEEVYRVDDPADIKTSEDLLTVIRLFNAAYDQSMQHLRRATPATVTSSE